MRHGRLADAHRAYFLGLDQPDPNRARRQYA
jgi:hypothetical protein